jgi:hypothetical protein
VPSTTSNTTIITITNLVASDIKGSIQFSVASIINPQSIQPQGSIDIIAVKDASKSMAKCLSTQITGITPSSFISATYTVTNSTVNAITNAYLNIQINSMLIATDNI